MKQGANGIPADIRTFCEHTMPQLIESLVAEAQTSSLRLERVDVVTPPRPEFAPDLQEIGFRASFGWPYILMTSPPMRNEARMRSEFGWRLCDIVAATGRVLERWCITTDGELRQVVGGDVAVWPLEFYAHLSAAVLGGYDQGLLVLNDGETLVRRIFCSALAGEPASIEAVASPG